MLILLEEIQHECLLVQLVEALLLGVGDVVLLVEALLVLLEELQHDKLSAMAAGREQNRFCVGISKVCYLKVW